MVSRPTDLIAAAQCFGIDKARFYKRAGEITQLQAVITASISFVFVVGYFAELLYATLRNKFSTRDHLGKFFNLT